MRPRSDEFKTPDAGPETGPGPDRDLKSLPMAALEKALDSSPTGVCRQMPAAASRRLTERIGVQRKKTRRCLE